MPKDYIIKEHIEEKLMFRDTHGDPVAFERLTASIHEIPADTVEISFYKASGGEEEEHKTLMYLDKRHVKQVRWLLETLESLD